MPLEGSEENIAVMRQAMLNKFEGRFKQYMSDHADVYDRHLSEEVIDASIVFYTSEEGVEITQKLPIIYTETDQLDRNLSKTMIREILNVVDEYCEDDIEDEFPYPEEE